MSASQIKFGEKHDVSYPGRSEPIEFEKSITNIKPFNNSSEGYLDTVEEKISVHSANNDKIANRDETERLKDSFVLDWIESQDQLSSFGIRGSTNSVGSSNKVCISRQSSLLELRQPSLISKPRLSSPKIMQASQPNPSLGSSQHTAGRESIALDIKDDVINPQYPITSSDYSDDFNLAGQLTDGPPEVKRRLSGDYNQLDEPIMVTLMRDLSGIYNKMKIITLPLSSYDIYKVVLRGWDLWGPLLLCTFLAFNLHHSENKDSHAGPHFADVFVLVWFGSCVISLNYRLLSISGANNQVQQSQLSSAYDNPKKSSQAPTTSLVSDQQQTQHISTARHEAPFQTLLSPPSIFQLMCVFGYCLVAPCFGLIVLKLFSLTRLFFERVIIGLIFGFAWPTFCSIRILVRYQHPEKRALAIYPIGLFYFILSCMIILNH